MTTILGEIERISSTMTGNSSVTDAFKAQSNFDHFIPIYDQAGYIIDFHKKEIRQRKGIYDLLGYTDKEFQYQNLTNIIHSEDRDLICHVVKTALICAYENGLDSNDRLYLTFRIKQKNGEFICVERLSGVYELKLKTGLYRFLCLAG